MCGMMARRIANARAGKVPLPEPPKMGPETENIAVRNRELMPSMPVLIVEGNATAHYRNS
jgi:hypothetical protein